MNTNYNWDKVLYKKTSGQKTNNNSEKTELKL